VRYGWATVVINAFTEGQSPVTSVLINQKTIVLQVTKRMDSLRLGRCDSLEDCFALGQEGVRGEDGGGELRRLKAKFADHRLLLGTFRTIPRIAY